MNKPPWGDPRRATARGRFLYISSSKSLRVTTATKKGSIQHTQALHSSRLLHSGQHPPPLACDLLQLLRQGFTPHQLEPSLIQQGKPLHLCSCHWLKCPLAWRPGRLPKANLMLTRFPAAAGPRGRQQAHSCKGAPRCAPM